MSSDNSVNAQRSDQALGKIITFYSYKGGTGRSMALANTAWLLALNGNRVLVVDWDLEAPGLHRYFHPFLLDKELRTTSGLMEMVEGLAVRAAASQEPLSEDEIDIVEYITMLECPRDSTVRIPWSRLRDRVEEAPVAAPTLGVGSQQTKRAVSPYVGIDLMAAGRQDGGYSRKLSTFNWIDFYERLDGRRLLGLARQQMREMYDYILIDSRTGVSDTSGICTVEMPDSLVICFTLNDQSIRGAAGIAESIREQRKVLAAQSGTSNGASAAFRIFPVPTRVEITAEKDKREIALEFAQKSFGSYLDHLSADLQSKYWGSVQMAYFPYYAFEEILAVFAEKPNDVLSLGTPLKYLMSAITDGAFNSIPPLDPVPDVADRIRNSVLNLYLRPKIKRNDPVVLAQRLYEEFDEAGRNAMRHTVLRLVSLERSAIGSRTALMTDFDERDASMALFLTERELLVMSGSDAGHTVRFRDPVVLEKWDTLRRWIEDDRQFLTWRVALGGSLNSWKLSEYNDSALMRGTVLDEASRLADSRPDDLCADEREFIQASVIARDKSAEEGKAAQSHAAAMVQAADARTADLQSQIAKLGVDGRKSRTWLDRNGTKVGIALGVLAMGWIAWTTKRAADEQAESARQATAIQALNQKIVDSVSALSRYKDSVTAAVKSNQAVTGVQPTQPSTASKTLDRAALLIREIERDNTRPSPASKNITELTALAKGSAVVRDSVRVASVRSKPTFQSLMLLYVLFKAGDRQQSSSLLNATDYRSADLARLAAVGTFTPQEWLLILPRAVDAVQYSDADINWFRALGKHVVLDETLLRNAGPAVVRASYRASTVVSSGGGDRAAAGFWAVVSWSPKAAVAAASTILSRDSRDSVVVREIGRALSGSSNAYAAGGLRRTLPYLNLPDAEASSAVWIGWAKEHADSLDRWRPREAAAK